MGQGDILGHEFMGTVEEVGQQVTNLKRGAIEQLGYGCGYDVSLRSRNVHYARDVAVSLVILSSSPWLGSTA
jgi:threonine dehydrogenase-like Zn-dependent dehydrogenase